MTKLKTYNMTVICMRTVNQPMSSKAKEQVTEEKKSDLPINIFDLLIFDLFLLLSPDLLFRLLVQLHGNGPLQLGFFIAQVLQLFLQGLIHGC